MKPLLIVCILFAIVLLLSVGGYADTKGPRVTGTPYCGGIGPRIWIPLVVSEKIRPTPMPSRPTLEATK